MSENISEVIEVVPALISGENQGAYSLARVRSLGSELVRSVANGSTNEIIMVPVWVTILGIMVSCICGVKCKLICK